VHCTLAEEADRADARSATSSVHRRRTGKALESPAKALTCLTLEPRQHVLTEPLPTAHRCHHGGPEERVLRPAERLLPHELLQRAAEWLLLRKLLEQPADWLLLWLPEELGEVHARALLLHNRLNRLQDGGDEGLRRKDAGLGDEGDDNLRDPRQELEHRVASLRTELPREDGLEWIHLRLPVEPGDPLTEALTCERIVLRLHTKHTTLPVVRFHPEGSVCSGLLAAGSAPGFCVGVTVTTSPRPSYDPSHLSTVR